MFPTTCSADSDCVCHCWHCQETGPDQYCDWCGEPSDTDICATCRRRYEEEEGDADSQEERNGL